MHFAESSRTGSLVIVAALVGTVLRGVRLHYVDWGGTGEVLVFLTANGGRPERQFDALAPNFVDRFHVMGLTRRGQGESEKPPSGYDLDSLARDLAGFLDAMGLDRGTCGYRLIDGRR